MSTTSYLKEMLNFSGRRNTANVKKSNALSGKRSTSEKRLNIENNGICGAITSSMPGKTRDKGACK